MTTPLVSLYAVSSKLGLEMFLSFLSNSHYCILMPTCLNHGAEYNECRVLVKQHNSKICCQDWFELGGARAWHSLSSEESGKPDCNMLGIHMLCLSGLTCCMCARLSVPVPQGSVLSGCK